MSVLAEVQFNDEDPIVVSTAAFPGDKEKIDLTAAAEEARRLRAPGADPLDEEELSITIKRHVPEDGVNTAIFGTTSFPDREFPAAGEGAEDTGQNQSNPDDQVVEPRRRSKRSSRRSE